MTTPFRRDDGRAAVFVVAGLLALMLAIPLSMWLSQAPSNLTQFERLGAEIGCQCGTCPMRPIATCGCGFADGMLARLSAETAAGRTDAEIMAAFAAEYGPGIQIKPEGRGFGLLAWVAPMSLLLVGVVVLAALITRWREESHESTDVPAAEQVGSTDGDNAEYRRQVEREIGLLDD